MGADGNGDGDVSVCGEQRGGVVLSGGAEREKGWGIDSRAVGLDAYGALGSTVC